MQDNDVSAILAAARDLNNHKPRGAVPRTGRGVARHNRKLMVSVSQITRDPQKAKQLEKEAREAGFTAVEFDQRGQCFISDRRQQHEYVYFKKGYVNTDGGYFETMKPSRMRELDRLRKGR
jgi:hypothetical protein